MLFRQLARGLVVRWGLHVLRYRPSYPSSNRSTKFDVLSAWTQNGVDKIDIRK
jgi:hypothetical protein